MKSFSNNLLNALDQESIRFYILVELLLNQTYRYTDAPSNLIFNGNVYTAQDRLYSYDPPKSTVYLDKETYRVTLIDHDNQFQAEARTGITGKQMNIYAAVRDFNNNLMLDPNDILTVYKGFVNGVSFSNDRADKLVFIEGASPVAKLDAVVPIITSQDSMRQYSATDTSFNQVYRGSTAELKWGKV
jgi:hypothetical protein